MAKSRLNLTVILKHLDLRNPEIYEAFSHDESDRKELERLLAYLLPVWMSGTVNERDQVNLLLRFNAQVNESWTELGKHPELRAKVLAGVGLGSVVRHDFHARVRRREPTLLTELLVQRYPDIRKDEVQLWCSCNSEANLIELCQDYGIQKKDRETILDEYRNLL